MDKERFRRKYLLGIFLSPLTLFPAAAGFTGFLGFMLFQKTVNAVVSLAIGLGLGLGILAQRLIIGSEKIAQKAKKETEDEERAERETKLDKLDKELRKTRGKQDEEALRELRFLVDNFNKSDLWKQSLDAVSANSLLSTIDEIFEQCLSSLYQTIQLYQLAQEAPSKRISDSILGKRDSIIKGVQDSVTRLNVTLCAAQELRVSNDQEAKLSRLSEELTSQLDIAKRVQERLENIRLNDYDAENTAM
ncbi:MAG: hypothetical protein JXA96_06060 [Sedimentisphaerales bacterium]|nr:hypothetical protein [Sedimentisphaerales bacterium]